MKTNIIIIFLSFLLFINCKEDKVKTNLLGSIDIKVTGNTEAANYFEKGLLLLHSFEYEDARESFLQAQETDSKMAMAYWGEAMTYNHTLWSDQDFEKATTSLKKLEKFDYKKRSSDLELDFIKAVQILYQPIHFSLHIL
jgi:tetratricopeptide (TPR) repeat protein